MTHFKPLFSHSIFCVFASFLSSISLYLILVFFPSFCYDHASICLCFSLDFLSFSFRISYGQSSASFSFIFGLVQTKNTIITAN